MKHIANIVVPPVLLTAAVTLAAVPAQGVQDYEILAARYGSIDDFPLRGLLPDTPEGETINIALAIWLIRDSDRTILFDTGFYREAWLDRFAITGYERPDRLLERLGVRPGDVTDIVISHAHWDHMGGIALFPRATIWIQAAEYSYYTGAAWQPKGLSGGIDSADVTHLVERNVAGQVRLIDGDSVEILPGVTVFTGARHTYASQYVMIGRETPYVLASDNAYLYRNLTELRAGATFSPDDRDGNLTALRRMLRLAGDPARVVPGHDAEQFRRFPKVTTGVVRIRSRSR